MADPTARTVSELRQLLVRAEALSRRVDDPTLSILLRRALIRATPFPPTTQHN
jgi:hypothetical protein